MVLLRTREGHQMLSFVPGAGAADIPLEDADIPLTFVLVAVEHEGRWLILYTSERRQWEIPGGAIEAGETPHDAAVREVFEETGQRAVRLVWKGLFKMRLQPDQRLEYGGLCYAELDEISPFVAHEEADCIFFWEHSTSTPVDGHFSELSEKLLEYC